MNTYPALDDDEPRFDTALHAPRPAPAWQSWLETAVLAALATAAGIADDRALPWLALGPLLAGLRYGSVIGVGCAVLQATAALVAARWQPAIDLPAAEALLGWLIAGLLSGQFRDAWNRRLRRAERAARGARERLEGLARAYHVTVASHDRLQRTLPGSPSSLRDALEAFAREAVEADAPVSHDRILALFRVHVSVRAASLHVVDAGGGVGPAAATLGTGAAHPDDPLIREALRTGRVASVRDLHEVAEALVAIPLIDVAGRVHAVVAVRELPFVALHDDTLALCAVLGGRLGDLLTRATEVTRAIVDVRPSRAFCASVCRAMQESREHGLPAALAIVELEAPPNEHPPRLLARCIAAHRRVTDEAEIVIGDGDRTVRVAVLLELSDEAGLARYLARIEDLARARAREDGMRCRIQVRGWTLADAPLPSAPGELEVAFERLLLQPEPMEMHHGNVA